MRRIFAAALGLGLILGAVPARAQDEEPAEESAAPAEDAAPPPTAPARKPGKTFTPRPRPKPEAPAAPADEEESSAGEHTIQADAPEADAPPPSTAPALKSSKPRAPSAGRTSGGGGGGGGAAAPAVDPKCSPELPNRAESERGKPGVADVILPGAAPSRSTVSRAILLRGDFLYVSGEPGMQTIDVSDPERMILTSDWAKSSAKMNGAAAKGSVLYVTNWHPGEGLVLFDLANPAKPKHLKTIATPNYSWEATVTGNLLDLTVGNETRSAIVTYDVTDPRNPVQIASIDIDRRLLGNATRHRGWLYFTQDHFLYAYDASDPAHPKRASEQVFDGLLGKTGVYAGYLYMLVGKAGVGVEHPGVRVFSLDDPAKPREVSFLPLDGTWGMHFQGSRMIVPATGNGVYTIDLSDPARPKVLSQWGVEWPGMGHGGYPVTSAGRGNYVFIGATGGNNPGCASFSCACYGARVYSVRQ